jgi:hypothetical protein
MHVDLHLNGYLLCALALLGRVQHAAHTCMHAHIHTYMHTYTCVSPGQSNSAHDREEFEEVVMSAHQRSLSVHQRMWRGCSHLGVQIWAQSRTQGGQLEQLAEAPHRRRLLGEVRLVEGGVLQPARANLPLVPVQGLWFR